MTKEKNFRLLSLGHRGVGKTVFLASICAEILRSEKRKEGKENFCFECQDTEFRENIEKLVDYTARTGQYPPPTFKITDFRFSLKRKTLKGDDTLCHFSWFDIPGELCDINNLEFQTLLLSSHGCCVFVDCYALLHQENYPETLEKVISQVEAIISLVSQHHLNYPFSLICTKCDLIEQTPIQYIQLEEKLRPLTKRFDLANAHYRQFYAAVPIVNLAREGAIPSKGVTAPLQWLISELNQIHSADAQINLGNNIHRALNSDTVKYSFTTQPKRQWKLSRAQKKIAAILAVCGLLGTISAIALNMVFLRPQTTVKLSSEQRIQQYEKVLQREPNNREAVSQIVNAYLELGQSDKAITQLQKALQSSPNNINLLFGLASLYGVTLQVKKEEDVYDQILKQQGDNIIALIYKANLRKNNGDIKAAKKLLQKAEKYASTDELKAQIREMIKE